MVILLAEDDVRVQRLVSTLLSDDGFTVLATDDGEAALEASASTPVTLAFCSRIWICPKWAAKSFAKRLRRSAPGSKCW